MEYSKLPIDCTRPITEFIRDQEEYFASKHGGVITRKATSDDIAKIEAELAAKKSNITFDICGELGRDKSAKRKVTRKIK